MIPGDNENQASEVLAYYALTERVDIIVPFVHNSEVRSHWRRFISSVYRFIINCSFGTSLNYTNGTVIYNRRILEDIELFSKGFFYQTELLVRLIRHGYLYAEVPYFLSRQGNKTKALSWRSFRVLTWACLKLMCDIHILRRAGRVNLKLHPQSATHRKLSQ